MANEFDDQILNRTGFSFRDLFSKDRWESWAPIFGSMPVVGATSYSGRYRIVGREVEFQVQFSAATSVSTGAGKDYLNLPITPQGYAGLAVMTNATSNTAVGPCHINVSTSRCYLPSQAASANVFTIFGKYEI